MNNPIEGVWGSYREWNEKIIDDGIRNSIEGAILGILYIILV